MPRLSMFTVLVGVTLFAHAPLARQAPTFDVASIRPNTSGRADGGVGLRPNGYAATNVLLRTMIVHAFRLKRIQVIDGPSWIVDSAR